jgi:predicted adenylyl cyclase CyaB
VRVVEKLRIRVESKVEHKMVELKAKVDDPDVVRRKLASFGAQHIGTFQQTDTYFTVPKGRLKLREMEGSNKAELIYYQRRNIAGPKRSNVFILKIQEPEAFKSLLKKLLKTSVTVEKVREIYRYREAKVAPKHRYIQIHLDNVENLGTFIEFEMEASEQREKRDRQILENLMKKLNIKANQLEKRSYSDLLQV